MFIYEAGLPIFQDIVYSINKYHNILCLLKILPAENFSEPQYTMRCLYCEHKETRVVDKRDVKGLTRRRRECLKCRKRFTTYEEPESIDIIVVKKDGRREPYQREKLTKGIKIACQKRPISSDKIEKVISEIENNIKERKSKEVSSKLVGELAMKKLRALDKVAYIRFASVYRSFGDIKEFEKEVRALKK